MLCQCCRHTKNPETRTMTEPSQEDARPFVEGWVPVAFWPCA